MKFEKLTELIKERITGEWGQEPTLSGVKVIRTTNFTNEGKLDLVNVVEREIEEKKVEIKSLQKGDIIIEKSGGGPTQPVGRVVYFDIESDEKYLCNNFTSILRPKGNLVISKYLLYQMLYLYKIGKTKKYQNKTTGIHNLNLDKYLQEKIALPPLPDQLHIANLLSKAENLIAQRKESIRLLDEYLKSTFLEMFGDPEKNPKNLLFTELEKLCVVIVDCPHSTPVKSEKATNYPCIRTSELTNGYISWDSMQYLEEDEYKKRTQRLIPEAGDIVYGREGTYGEAIRIPSTHKFSLGQRTMLFRPDYKKTNSIFLWAMVRSEFVYRQAKKKNSGSTVGHVNVKDIKQFRVYNPPIELQTQFAQIVEKTEALKTQYQQSLQELENLYGSLSQRAFRGELVFQQNIEEQPKSSAEEDNPGIVLEKILSVEKVEKETDEVEVSMKSTKKIIPNLQPVPTHREKIKLSYKIFNTIKSNFRNEYFSFEEIKDKLLKKGHNYEFETIRDEIFNLLRENKLQQVFADAAFKSSFDKTHPDYKVVQELEERIYLTLKSERK